MGVDAGKSHNARAFAERIAMTIKYIANMDPLEEIQAIKKEIYQKFKSVEAYDEYLKNTYPNGANPEKFVRPEKTRSIKRRISRRKPDRAPEPQYQESLTE